jgi:hypothetical protein
MQLPDFNIALEKRLMELAEQRNVQVDVLVGGWIFDRLLTELTLSPTLALVKEEPKTGGANGKFLPKVQKEVVTEPPTKKPKKYARRAPRKAKRKPKPAKKPTRSEQIRADLALSDSELQMQIKLLIQRGELGTRLKGDIPRQARLVAEKMRRAQVAAQQAPLPETPTDDAELEELYPASSMRFGPTNRKGIGSSFNSWGPRDLDDKQLSETLRELSEIRKTFHSSDTSKAKRENATQFQACIQEKSRRQKLIERDKKALNP